MYASFFGLRQAPFSIAPDPHYLYMSERHREALAHLLYGLGGGGGFVLLSGEIGAGKTTVCRCFLEQIPAQNNVAYIFNPKLTVTELLQSICEEFHIPVPAGAQTVKDYLDPLNAFLLAAHAAGQNNVLIIDEAQNLSAGVLEQLRLLTNLETAERKLLQIILIGQPELRGMLAQPELEQLAQRVIARFHLQALSESETGHYVRHRMAVAGLSGPLPFDAAALHSIHRISRGVPRRINLLCDRALLGAYAHGRASVGADIVQQAAREVFDDKPPGPAAAAQPRLRSATRWGAGLGLAGLFGLGAWVLLGAGGRSPLARPAAASQPVAGLLASAAPAPASDLSRIAATAPAASVASAPALPPLSASELTQGLSEPAQREAEAWRGLARSWNVDLADTGEPCSQTGRLGLPCFRSAAGSLALIRQLDRPVLLTLHPPAAASAAASNDALLLVGLGERDASVLFEGQLRALPLASLASLWRGEFVTLWRSPPGYPGVGAKNAAALEDWLRLQLGPLTGTGAAASAADKHAAELLRQIQAFQVAQGLQPDGRSGPITFMHLNRAAGVAEPRLDSRRLGPPVE